MRWLAHVGLELSLIVRSAASSILRFRYELKSDRVRLLTKANGKEQLHLARVAISPGATEVRLSDYNSMVHSYVPTEVTLSEGDFADSRSVMGPLLTWQVERGHALLAYEHGSQYPDAYLSFSLDPDHSVTLVSTKGTYMSGTNLQSPFSTVWLHLGAVLGPRTALEKA